MKYILLFLILSACNKQQDFSYLNTDRRNCKSFARISNRFNINWKYLTTIRSTNYEEACDSNIAKYQSVHDTTIWKLNCPPPDTSMPEFRIEVRYYEQVK